MSDRSRNLPPASGNSGGGIRGTSEGHIDNSAKNQLSLWQNASRLFSATTAASLLGLVSFALTARALGVSEFGALALAFTFANAIGRLCAFQSWQAIIRFVSEYAARGDEPRVAATFRAGYSVDIASTMAAAALTYFTAEWFGGLFEWQPRVVAAVQWYAIAVLFSIDGSPTAVLRYFERFGTIARYHVVNAATKLILVAMAWVLAPSFNSFLLVWITSHIFGYVVLNFLALKTLRDHSISLVHTGASWRSVATPSMMKHLGISNMESSLRVLRELDVQIVALLADEAAAGLLRVARQLANFSGRVIDAFYEAIYPQFAKLSANSRWNLLRSAALRTSMQTGALALAGCLLFAAVGQPLLTIIFGADYSAAYQPTCILLLAMTVWGFTQPFSPALMSIGAAGTLLRNHALAAASYLLLLYLLVPNYSYLGAAWAMVGLYSIWGLTTFMSFRTQIPITEPKPGSDA